MMSRIVARRAAALAVLATVRGLAMRSQPHRSCCCARRDRLFAYGVTIGLGLAGAICLRLLAPLLTVLNQP